MIPSNRIPTHPGEILSVEFLGPLEISQVRLAESSADSCAARQ
jgi:plasmid maintenance system antidote protein VapI